MSDLQKLTQKVGQIYTLLDEQIWASQTLNKCQACGNCCDFEKFDHLLYVTTPELVYLYQRLEPEKVKTMQTAICPYRKEGKCTIYPLRFAGCRIFFCKGDKDFQGRLSESAIKSFKSLCAEFDIPYIYSDLKQALKDSNGVSHPLADK